MRRNGTSFLLDDIYRNPGPLQFDGPGADAKPITLSVEDQDYMGRIKKLQEYLEQVLTINSDILAAHEPLEQKNSNFMCQIENFKSYGLYQAFQNCNLLDWS